jgi:hypothetical protein
MLTFPQCAQWHLYFLKIGTSIIGVISMVLSWLIGNELLRGG